MSCKTWSLTIGNGGENHTGMEFLGNLRKSGEGWDLNKLLDAKDILENIFGKKVPPIIQYKKIMTISICAFGDRLQRSDRIIGRRYVMCPLILWYSSGRRVCFRVPMVCRGARNPTARVRSSRVRLFIFLLENLL